MFIKIEKKPPTCYECKMVGACNQNQCDYKDTNIVKVLCCDDNVVDKFHFTMNASSFHVFFPVRNLSYKDFTDWSDCYDDMECDDFEEVFVGYLPSKISMKYTWRELGSSFERLEKLDVIDDMEEGNDA